MARYPMIPRLPALPIRLPGATPPRLSLGIPGALLSAAAAGIVDRHPNLVDRLDGYLDARVLIDPAELPVVFLVALNGGRPAVSLHWNAAPPACAATISGRLPDLIGMFDGEADGDALFFSRAISIAGDTSTILALRNALDSEEIDLVRELTAALGPLADPARRAAGFALKRMTDIHDRIDALRRHNRRVGA